MFHPFPTVLSFVLLCSGPITGYAETYPARPIHLISPFPAGSGPDAVSRLVGEKLSQKWGQPLVVDARPGGNGFIALDALRRAPATGYELGIADIGHLAINPGLFKKLPYDPVKDFVPVTGLYRNAFFVMVSSRSAIRSIPDLIAAARVKPDNVTYGSWAVGSAGHLGAAQLAAGTGTELLHVPYKDTAQLYTAVANGDVTWALGSYATAGPLVQAGKLRVLAVADKVRSPALPDVPTLQEAGGPAGMETESWLALIAPAGTPPALVSSINRAVRDVMGEPDVKAKLATFGFMPAAGPADVVRQWIDTDLGRYAAVIRRTGATIDN